MTVPVRPYQDDMIAAVRAALRRNRRVCLQAPTGSGKTRVLCYMADGALKKLKRTTFVVHRAELLRQASDALDSLDLPHGRIAPGESMTRDLIQVAAVQTLIRRLDKLPAPDLLVLDEAHHANASTWGKLIDNWADARMVGLTATPCRLDGRGLGDIFGELVIGPSVRWLIDQGYLADYRIFAPPIGIETGAVSKRAGDFAKDALARLVDKPGITGDAVRHYHRLASGRKAIVFCVSVAHSKHVVEQFRSTGVRAEHLDGTENDLRRQRVVQSFVRGETKVLSAVDLFGEGFDVPDAEVAILLRPTQSLSLHLQQVGRVLRPVYAPDHDLRTVDGRLAAIAASGKPHAIILDHAGNSLRHGLPDEERDWTLKGRPRKAGSKAPAVRQCPVCFACHLPRPICPECGHVYGAAPREIEERDGQLEQVNEKELKAARLKMRERLQKNAKTLDDLYKVAKQLGYKPEWAERVHHGRMRRAGY